MKEDDCDLPSVAARSGMADEEEGTIFTQKKWWEPGHARVFYPWPWYHPCKHFWPIVLCSGLGSLTASYVCSRMFESGIRHFKGRVFGAVCLSMLCGKVIVTFVRSANIHGASSHPDLPFYEAAVYTGIAAGPLAGFFGGAAVSQPTRKITYKGNPLFFVAPVWTRYCLGPVSLSVATITGLSTYYLMRWRMEGDAAWKEQQYALLRRRYDSRRQNTLV